MSTKTAIADRYVRVEDFAARVDGVEFAPEVWSVFAQLEQARSAAELASALSLDVEAVQSAIRRLLRRKLIRKHVLGWRDFAATAAPASTATPPPAVRPPSPVAPRSAASSAPFSVVSPPTPAPPPAPAALSPGPVLSVTVTQIEPAPLASSPTAANPEADAPVVSLFLGPARPPAQPEKPLVSLRFASATSAPRLAAAPVAPVVGRWRLRPVIDAIGARAGGGLAGQLLVYRVFLQVPTDLLQAAGLHSLSLVDENFTVNHPPLRKAIVEAARRHADVDLTPLLAA